MNEESARKAGLRLIVKIIIVAALLFILLHFVLGIFVVHSNDMFPAVRDGDLLITYRIKDAAYGDIIAYKADGQRLFGRVVGLPGDVIDMDSSGNYSINGSIPYETVYYETRSADDSNIEFPYTVGEDEVFLLNDYRENFGDSRIFGAISDADTDGSVVLLLRRRGW